MPRPSPIPERLHDVVLEKAGESWSQRRIAEWLEAEHGLKKLNHVAVGRLLTKLRAARTEITKAVLTEKIGKSVTSDLDGIDRQIGRLEGAAERLASRDLDGDEATIGNTPRASVLAGVEGQLRALRELKLKFSGAAPSEAGPGGVVVLPAQRTDDDE